VELRLLPSGEVRLEGADEFRRFAVRVPRGVDARTSPLAALVTLDGAHAWVPPETVRALHPAADAAWQQGFDAMVAYASGKGWTDGAGRIRAHIEEA
jgi:hypothetical protein